ncbi:MAG: hypothetical protein PUP91_17085 [Rhizonema sp. PD37]|nr:hypothetical protein [Rhizonema sp. PD37]
MLYYGYRCYNNLGEPLGWLYTYNNDINYGWTEKKDLDWCKRWKTEKGAKNNLERYNSRWQFQSKGGYLQIEVMPDIKEPESAKSHSHKLIEEWGEDVTHNIESVHIRTISFQPKPEVIQWLEKQRKMYDNGEYEPIKEVLNRQLEKLMKLE